MLPDSSGIILFQQELTDQIMGAMKKMLVVNDAYGGGGRSVIRESILREMNVLKRMASGRLEALCLDTTGSGSV